MNIHGCTLKFRCPKHWDALTHTGNEDVRFCETCHKNVYRIRTVAEYHQHAKQSHCIVALLADFASAGNDTPSDEELAEGEFMGDPE